MKKMIFMLLCLIMTALSFTACGNGQESTGESTLPAQTEQEVFVTESDAAAETEPVAQTDANSAILDSADVPVGIFEVETPYCMLTYPLAWQYNLAIEQTDTENSHIVSFYAVIEGKENLRVFDVIFGEDGGLQGDLVGQLEGESGAVPVFFKTYSVYENEELSYDESEMLLAMIEDITVIYNGLSVLENFN